MTIPGIDLENATFEPSGDERSGDETSATPTRTRRKRSDAGVPRGTRSTTGRKSPAANKALVDELLDPIAKFAKAVAFQTPTGAAVLLSRGENTAKSLVKIAEGHPRMMAALQRASQIGPASDLIETGVMLMIAIQVDMGRLPPNHPLAGLTGVTELWAQMNPEQPPADASGQIPLFTPPPGFGTPPNVTDPNHPMYSFAAGSGASQMGPFPG